MLVTTNNTMQSAMRQVLRARSRLLASTSSRVMAGHRILPIASSYKARPAARTYATATATKAKTAAKKAPAAKKTAVKKPAAKKAPAKKAVAKKKPAAKKKAAVKKPAPKKKKVLTPEEKKEKKKALEKKELRAKAMINQEPKTLPRSGYLVFQQKQAVGSLGMNKNFGEQQRAWSAAYNALSESEKQRYEEEAARNKITNAANYKKWVESHSAAEIAEANRARARLIRYHNVKISPKKITDERLPKGPAGSYALFIRAELAGATDRTTAGLSQAAAKWKQMSAAEKQGYVDLAAAEKATYLKEKERLAL